MTTTSFPELLQLRYRPDLDILFGRWGYQPAPELLPAVYAQLTDCALASRCLFWLQDIRRRSSNDPQITRWLFTEYFLQMATRLGGRLCVAYLTGPTLMETIQTSPSYLPPSSYAKLPFAVALFSDEGAAVQWLQEQQRERQR